MPQTMTFDQALDAVECLSNDEQADLVEVVRRRLAERGRARVVEEVRQGQAEFDRGEAKVMSVDEIMREIRS